ncbi:unnamed protein product [Heterotrigona itama]|uniref:Uncharacterized protein n=1 Tax=Heterotrigona itama TaxID=395501 RepID=A0A6V7HH69_9HYME|nr:unnamed protein product [Heterotrigona itama]
MFLEGFAYLANLVSSSPLVPQQRLHERVAESSTYWKRSRRQQTRLTRHAKSRRVNRRTRERERERERESFGQVTDYTDLQVPPSFFDDTSSTALGMHTRRGLTP